MKRSRLLYGVLIFAVVAAGILSRRISAVPLITGDVLWAVMMFLLIRFLFIGYRLSFAGITSLSVCYLVEVSQLYHEPWIDQVRHTLIGGLVLGQGFLWSDIFAYTLGIGICVLIETRLQVPGGFKK